MSQYAQQKLFEAVEALVGPDDLRQRLAWAKTPIAVLADHPSGSSAVVQELAEGFRSVPIETMTDRQMEVFAQHILAAYEQSIRLQYLH